MIEPKPPTPILIIPDAFYQVDDIIQLLGVTYDSITKAQAAGKLRCSQIGRAKIYKGAWIIAWIEGSHAERACPKCGTPHSAPTPCCESCVMKSLEALYPQGVTS